MTPDNALGIAAIVVPTIIPTVTVVLAILRSDSKIDALRTDINSQTETLRKIAYEHHGRITALETRKKD